jgi:hypothetical protein
MAAGSTYTPIATQTLGSNQTSITFNSFSGYTDLVLIASLATTTSGSSTVKVQFNGDTGTNYSITELDGSGSAAGSGRYTNQTSGRPTTIPPTGTVGDSTLIFNIMNYSNSTTYKTCLGRGGRTSSSASYPGTDAAVTLWRNTNAITSFSIFFDTGNLLAGSTLTLYGILAA